MIVNVRASRASAQRGFTLLEIIVAFAILAIGLAVSVQIATGALRQTKRGAEFTDAALYAQSYLDTYGFGEVIEEGEDSGEFNERYRYTVSATPYISPLAQDFDPSSMPTALMKITLTVYWGDEGRERKAVFETLRAMNPASLVNKS